MPHCRSAAARRPDDPQAADRQTAVEQFHDTVPVRYGTVRYGTGTVRYRTLAYGTYCITVRYGTVRFGTVRYGTVHLYSDKALELFNCSFQLPSFCAWLAATLWADISGLEG